MINQPHSLAQFRIPVKTNKQGVAVFDGNLIPYVKRSLDVTHVKMYWSYYVYILPGNSLSCFPALTKDIVQDFLTRLNLINNNMFSMGKVSFEAEIVSAFNQSGHTSRGQHIDCTQDIEELICILRCGMS